MGVFKRWEMQGLLKSTLIGYQILLINEGLGYSYICREVIGFFVW